MIHTLEDYICRSIDPSKPFSTNPNLGKKVDLKRDHPGFVQQELYRQYSGV